MDEGWRGSALDRRQQRVLAFTDAFLQHPTEVPVEVRSALQEELSEDQIVELATGLALFHGFSKMLIALGLEPEQMDTLVLPTPDVPAR